MSFSRSRFQCAACVALVFSTAAPLSAAVLTVTNTADSGAGSLRAAIATVAASDTIDLTGVTGTITLTTALPAITGDLTINGPGEALLTISGNDLVRVFTVSSGNVAISGLTIAHGAAIGENGHDRANAASGGGGGGAAGLGGGLLVENGTIALTDVTFDHNQAQGGSGGNSSFPSVFFGDGGAGGGPSPGSGGTVISFVAQSGGAGGVASGGGGGGADDGAGAVGGAGGFGGGGGGGGGRTAGGPGGLHGVGGAFAGNGGDAFFSGGGGGGGGAGLGGGVCVLQGTLVLNHCTFNNNIATQGAAGTGSAGGSAGQGKGGAVFLKSGATAAQLNVILGTGPTANTATDDLAQSDDNDDVFGTVLLLHPVVVSINRASPSPTNAATVDFTVVFSSAVTGVDVSDFSLAASGLTGASIASVSGSGETYTLTVNTGAGEGTLKINLVDNDSVQDSAAFDPPVGGTGNGNGDFTTGETYNVDTVAPNVISVTVHDALSVDVTFSEAAASGATTAANYTISGTGTGTIASHPDSVALVSGNSYRLTWNAGEMHQGGDVTITAVNVADAIGNAASSSGTATAGGIGTAPTVTSLTSGSATILSGENAVFDVVFSEAVTGFNAAGDAVVAEQGVTHTGVSITSVSATQYQVTVSGITGAGTLALSIPAGAAQDAATNLSQAGGPSTSVTVTAPAPVLSLNLAADVSAALALDEIGLMLQVANTGETNATNVVVTVTLPAGIQFVSAERLTPAGAPAIVAETAGGVLTLRLGTVSFGGSTSVRVVLRATVGGDFDLTGEVTCTELTSPVQASTQGHVDVENRSVQIVTRTGPVCGVLGGAPLIGFAVALTLWSARRRR